MSRSRKKEPVYKDPYNSRGKKTANRNLRRKIKDAIHHGNDNMPLLDEALNAYNIVDFKYKAYDQDFAEQKRVKRK
jgi:hypothetical protein